MPLAGDTPPPYLSYREHVEAALADSAQNQSSSYSTWHKAETLGRGAALVQLAVGDRLARRDGGGGRPFRSAAELREAASTKRLPPEPGPTLLSRNLLEGVLRQPAMLDGRLGPIQRAAVQVIGESIREKQMVVPTALMPIARTIELSYLRAGKGVGARAEGQGVAAVAAISPDNGGTAMVMATHPQLQHGADESRDVLSIASATSHQVMDPLDLRLDHVAAVRSELLAITGEDLAVVFRGERRFVEPHEGTMTDSRPWLVADQPSWRQRVEDKLPDGVVLIELGQAHLQGATYHFAGHVRRIGNPAAFLRDVVSAEPYLGVRRVFLSKLELEKELNDPDDLLALDGNLVLAGGGYFTLLVISSPSAVVPFVITSATSSRFSSSQWDAVRAGLSPIHGGSGGASSDDQGLAITLPARHALDMASEDWDKTCNLESFRTFSHAVEMSNHWYGSPGAQPTLGNQRMRRAS